MRHFGFGFYSRQGAKNAEFRTIISLFFAAFASLREILRFFWLRLCRAGLFASFVVRSIIGLTRAVSRKLPRQYARAKRRFADIVKFALAVAEHAKVAEVIQ